jgi:alanyl-tRNA synthetase
MVQFKDVFLGTDNRTYSRAVNSQKCMRVAGKHNDLDDVGRDDTHHTFFEMLGNWSFGDYYKREAITWAWELLTEVWGLDKTSLWVTCFKDEKGEIPTDDEAASVWAEQPGINPEHIVFFGRKENFWEMADVGPCGPDSEIHIDMGEGFCNKKHEPGHVCRVNGDCNRIIELWNLVFIQYNRIDATTLEPLPATHVDTGMGFERITSVIQHVNSNYRTDLFTPLTGKVRELTGYSIADMDADFTPFRVIADHARAAAFLIADGVVPGNTGRNYICRMIIRRASRFGAKIGLTKPFLAEIAQAVIENYGKAYPELQRNKKSILDNITREETRFHRTIETGMQRLDELMQTVRNSGSNILPGKELFDLYATHGLPLELSRDEAREHGLDVDESGFKQAMEEHRDASGAGKSFGALGGEEVELFREVVEELIEDGSLDRSGVLYDPYTRLSVKTPVLALFSNGERVTCALENDAVDVIFPETCFYVEAGGQIADQGTYRAGGAVIKITDVRRPAAGAIVHRGVILQGKICDGDEGVLEVDADRRNDIMRNHTATHLLHAALHKVLGDHARQAGSLVAPDKLRFDFTHPEAMTHSEIELVQNIINEEIAHGYRLNFIEKKLDQAMEEGAMALFGEKYGDVVRTVTIADGNEKISYELCGGTHVTATNDIGMFLIVSESSAAAGIRRIEAVTGRGAYDLVRKRLSILQRTSQLLETNVEEVPEKIIGLLEESETRRKQFQKLQQEQAIRDFQGRLNDIPLVKNVPVLAVSIQQANADILRTMADLFRNRYKSGVVVLGTVVEEKPMLIAAVTDDLVQKGISANDIVKVIAPAIGGSGGGRPALAQAGGKDPSRLDEALQQVAALVSAKL